jgi:hypothetical protein
MEVEAATNRCPAPSTVPWSNGGVIVVTVRSETTERVFGSI